MGTSGTFDSGNRLKDKEEWVTCRKCGLEYPKIWSRCSVCRTATVSKKYGGLLAGAVVIAFFLLGSYGLSQTSENIITSFGSLPRTTESYSEPTVSVPETGLYQSHVNKDFVANFTITSGANSALYFIKLVDVTNESNVMTLFVKSGRINSWRVDMTPQNSGNLHMDDVSKGQW